jgi:hypothetical protein
LPGGSTRKFALKTYEEIMKKLIALAAAVLLGVSTLGCAEHKAPAPAPTPTPVEGAKDNATTPAPEGGAAPAPATDEKK